MVATGKNADALSKIGKIRCSVTATESDWLAEGKVSPISPIYFHNAQKGEDQEG